MSFELPGQDFSAVSLDETAVHYQVTFFCEEMLFFSEHFRYYSAIELSIDYKRVLKNFLLSTCCCWNERTFSREEPICPPGWNQWLCRLVLGLHLLVLKRIQTTCNTTRCHWSSGIAYWQSTWALLYGWTRTNLMLAWSLGCNTIVFS